MRPELGSRAPTALTTVATPPTASPHSPPAASGKYTARDRPRVSRHAGAPRSRKATQQATCPVPHGVMAKLSTSETRAQYLPFPAYPCRRRSDVGRAASVQTRSDRLRRQTRGWRGRRRRRNVVQRWRDLHNGPRLRSTPVDQEGARIVKVHGVSGCEAGVQSGWDRSWAT